LIGAVIVVSAVSIYVFGSHADSTLTIILVAIGLILIVLAIPVYNWESARRLVRDTDKSGILETIRT
jgi:uncharacterized membrane protein